MQNQDSNGKSSKKKDPEIIPGQFFHSLFYAYLLMSA